MPKLSLEGFTPDFGGAVNRKTSESDFGQIASFDDP
jgi:hypothetical protein